MPWTREQKRRTSQLYREPVERKVDEFLSTVESLLIAVSQRGMTPAQMDRLAAVLQRAELDLLRRCTTSDAPARRPAAARSSGRSRKAEAA